MRKGTLLSMLLLVPLVVARRSSDHRQEPAGVNRRGRSAGADTYGHPARGSAMHLAKEVEDLSGDTKLLASVTDLGSTSGPELPSTLRSDQTGTKKATGPREGYVTLCYRDSYVLGVRVLGQSLRDTNTQKDLVVLVSRGGVSQDNIDTLSRDGWIVVMVDIVRNPGQGPLAKGKGGFPPRFWAVYTKLTIYTLTDYDKLIYLDADILVMGNIDHLFACSGFCAVMRGGERFNSGLMVLEPDQKVYDEMIELIASTPSYTGGDQGFLNEYYSDILEAPVFRPHLPKQPESSVMRLTTEYNADVGGYIINSGLWQQQNEPKVLHYTLGPFKPWHWWMSWVAEQHSLWMEARGRLGEDSNNYTGGGNLRCTLATWVMAPLPWVVWTGLFLKQKAWAVVSGGGHGKSYGSRGTGGFGAGGMLSFVRDVGLAIFGYRGAGCGASVGLLQHRQGMLEASSLVGLLSAICSLAFAVTMVVPHDIRPLLAWLLVYEWTFLGTSLAVWQLLVACYRLGAGASSSASRYPHSAEDACSPRGLQVAVQGGGSGSDLRLAAQEAKVACSGAVASAWGVTAESALLSAACLAVSPWVPRLLGVHDLVAKILITAFSGVGAVIVFCHSVGRMASVWFTAGMSDATQRHIDES